MIRTLAALSVALALAGCAGGRELAPPGMPTVAAIEAQQASLATVTNPADFYKTGLLLTQENCGGYFDQAVLQALKNARTSGQEQLLTGLLTGLMGLSGAGGPVTAGVGLAAGIGQQLLANQEDTSLAGADPAATATLVAAAQSALIQAEANPATAADAYADIYAIYRACSPAGIRGLEEAAIAAAPSHLVVSGGSSGAAARFGLPASAALPSVTVH